ncbi:MAG: hypothetical protein IJ789_02225, partial [Bacteroidales bacterium]|nr:hypothetical protein [Bacteroidales bacterium]
MKHIVFAIVLVVVVALPSKAQDTLRYDNIEEKYLLQYPNEPQGPKFFTASFMTYINSIPYLQFTLFRTQTPINLYGVLRQLDIDRTLEVIPNTLDYSLRYGLIDSSSFYFTHPYPVVLVYQLKDSMFYFVDSTSLYYRDRNILEINAIRGNGPSLYIRDFCPEFSSDSAWNSFTFPMIENDDYEESKEYKPCVDFYFPEGVLVHDTFAITVVPGVSQHNYRRYVDCQGLMSRGLIGRDAIFETLETDIIAQFRPLLLFPNQASVVPLSFRSTMYNMSFTNDYNMFPRIVPYETVDTTSNEDDSVKVAAVERPVEVTLMPNPAKGKTTVRSSSLMTTLTLTSPAGQIVTTLYPRSNQAEL